MLRELSKLKPISNEINFQRLLELDLYRVCIAIIARTVVGCSLNTRLCNEEDPAKVTKLQSNGFYHKEKNNYCFNYKSIATTHTLQCSIVVNLTALDFEGKRQTTFITSTACHSCLYSL
jgi:hypothetical protein